MRQRLVIELSYFRLFFFKHNSVKLIYVQGPSHYLLHVKLCPESEQERKLLGSYSLGLPPHMLLFL